MFCSRYPSPVGRLSLVGDGQILTGLYLEKNCPAVLPPEGLAPVFPQATHWLDLYFQGIAAPVDFPLALQGTPFQQEVWNILRTVPFGRTLTYGAAAQMLGRPMSPQAVGGAVGHNPISIIIPCHRIIGSSGRLTGYAGGLEAKQWLLHHEGVIL